MSTIEEEDVYKHIKCCIGKGVDHYVNNDAVLLTCSGNACKKCIESLSDLKVKCKYCLQEHDKVEMLKGQSNQKSMKYLIQAYMKDLSKKLLEEFKETVELFKEDNINHEIEERFQNIEYQIDAKIESIITELHKYRDEFIDRLKKAKTSFKNSIVNNRSMKAQMMEINKHELSLEANLNYLNFMKTQEIIKDSQNLLQRCLNEINEIKFISSDEPIEKSLIGELSLPFWKKIKVIVDKTIEDANDLSRFVHLKSKNKIIVTDYKNGCLFLFDLDNGSIRKFEHEKIKKPFAICCGKDDKLLITASLNERRVLIFDRDLNFEREFKIKNELGVTRMKVEEFSQNNNLLFITHLNANQVTIWNYDTGIFINSFNVDSPSFIGFTKEHIYINSHAAYIAEGGILKNIEKGSNCIFILNKTNYEVVKKIECDNWLSPWGLCFDEHFSLMTTAQDLNESKVISTNLFLYVFDEQGNLKSKNELKLHLIDGANDMILFDDKLARLHQKSIKIIEMIE